jgi:type II secretion system protein G
MKTQKQKGFTLIELLVVVAIIGVLATIVLSSLSNARAQARDARRVSEMKNLEKALEMYYLDYNQYPPFDVATDTYASVSIIEAFESSMAPYITIDLMDKLYSSQSGSAFFFYYKSKPGQNYQNYGMMASLEVSSLEKTDGGYYSTSFELGPNPRYCKNKYGGAWYSTGDRCDGGN